MPPGVFVLIIIYLTAMSASTRVLITAFEPYDRWPSNSSWLAIEALTQALPGSPKVTTRRYPVDLPAVRERLASDLSKNYDVVLHLGQSPGLGRIHLESIGINIGGNSKQRPDEFGLLEPAGPVAYRSQLPLAEWARKLRSAGVPAQVSYHAGTFLCNATLYLTHHHIATYRLETRATFVHLPLTSSQVTDDRHDIASLPVESAANALRLLLQEIEAW